MKHLWPVMLGGVYSWPVALFTTKKQATAWARAQNKANGRGAWSTYHVGSKLPFEPAMPEPHRGEFETCNERECYACHPSVLPG